MTIFISIVAFLIIIILAVLVLMVLAVVAFFAVSAARHEAYAMRVMVRVVMEKEGYKFPDRPGSLFPPTTHPKDPPEQPSK